MYRLTLLLALMLPHITQAQQQVQKSPEPSWIAPTDYANEISDTLNSGGQYYLLSEWQYHAEKKQSYQRDAIKVITEKGLESASSIQVNFDPSNQKLAFHHIIIKRGDTQIDVLKTARFELLRREENMDRLIYDKSLDAILNIEDVQVGDIVEYSYSITGQNPVFDDRVFESFWLNYSVPVGKSLYRIVCNPKRHLNIKKFNGARDPEISTSNDLTSYVWEQTNVPAVFGEDSAPSWYNPYDKIQVSEYNSWEEVSRWALPLYSGDKISSPEIDKKIADIKNGNATVEQQINFIIKFVQDEVRYLSFSDGVRGYKPHNPANVFKQRFGDCKDKSFLLTYMLNKIGVKSYPALVHSSRGKSLADVLPMPTVFDHCIAQLEFNDSIYWVDATVTLDRAGFKASTQANYSNALVIAPQTKSLVAIDMKPTNSRVQVNEVYSFKVVGGAATLNVKTVYEGDEATSMRNYYKSNSAQEIKKNYTDFYARDYSEVAMVDYVVFEDDAEKNIITTTENYNVGNFWEYDSATGTYTADTYARVLAHNLNVPTSKARHAPLAVSYPVSITQHITIHVSEPFNVTEKTKAFASPAFSYTSSADYVDQTINLDYKYEALRGYVTAEESKNHIDKIEKASNDLGFQLTYKSKTAESNVQSDFNMPYLVIMMMLVPFIVIGFKRLYYYDPRSQDYDTAYEQFGGWLILPIIGVFFAPLATAINMISSGFFEKVYWDMLASPGHVSYNFSLGLFNLFKFILSTILIGFQILLIILLIQRRTSFPRLIIFVYATNVLYLFIDAFWRRAIDLPTSLDNPKQAITYLAPVIFAAVWIPFFIYSERVKGTFRERL